MQDICLQDSALQKMHSDTISLLGLSPVIFFWISVDTFSKKFFSGNKSIFWQGRVDMESCPPSL